MTWFSINIFRATGTRLDPSVCALIGRLGTVAGQVSLMILTTCHLFHQLLSVLVSLRYSRRSAWSLSSGLVCLAWLGLALTVHSGQAEAGLFSVQEPISGEMETSPLGLLDYLPPLLVLVLRVSFQVNNNDNDIYNNINNNHITGGARPLPLGLRQRAVPPGAEVLPVRPHSQPRAGPAVHQLHAVSNIC